MPKAQVLVTVTAEALIDVPEGVEDVAAYCREHVHLAWGDLQVDSVVQPAGVSVEHYLVPDPEPEPILEAVDAEPVAESASEPVEVVADAPVSSDDTLPLPAVSAPASPQPEPEVDIVALFDDPAYRTVIRAAIRERAERLIEDVVNQVVAELEPLLQRHLSKKASGAP